MIRYENECCGCAVPGYPCTGSCHLRSVPRYSCDICGEDFKPDELFDIDGQMVCEDCAKENITFEDLLEACYGKVRI